MLNFFFNISDFLYNNIFYYYYIYITIYKFSIYIKFYIQYVYNIFMFYIISTKTTKNFFSIFLYFYNIIKNILLWTNRRFLKKNKRFRIYYKYHNVRYWKFFLFFFYANLFFFLWKKRNLYKKIHLISFFVFLHITILISLHFFVGLWNNFDIGFFSCLLFIYIIFVLFKR
jgi:hypothetical protein